MMVTWRLQIKHKNICAVYGQHFSCLTDEGCEKRISMKKENATEIGAEEQQIASSDITSNQHTVNISLEIIQQPDDSGYSRIVTLTNQQVVMKFIQTIWSEF